MADADSIDGEEKDSRKVTLHDVARDGVDRAIRKHTSGRNQAKNVSNLQCNSIFLRAGSQSQTVPQCGEQAVQRNNYSPHGETCCATPEQLEPSHQRRNGVDSSDEWLAEEVQIDEGNDVDESDWDWEEDNEGQRQVGSLA
jgi:hypothetical protein